MARTNGWAYTRCGVSSVRGAGRGHLRTPGSGIPPYARLPGGGGLFKAQRTYEGWASFVNRDRIALTIKIFDDKDAICSAFKTATKLMITF